MRRLLRTAPHLRPRRGRIVRFFSIATPAIIAIGTCGCSWSYIVELQRRQSRERNEERLRIYERMYGPLAGPQTREQIERARKLHSLRQNGRWEDMEASLARQEPPSGQRYTAQNMRLRALRHLGRFEEVLALAKDMYEEHQQAEVLRLSCLMHMLHAYDRLHDVDGVKTCLAKLEPQLLSRDWPSGMRRGPNTCIWLANGYLRAGRWQEAHDWTTRAEAEIRSEEQRMRAAGGRRGVNPSTRTEVNPFTHAWYAVLLARGRAAFHLGRFAEAEQALDRAIDRIRSATYRSTPVEPDWPATLCLARTKEALGKHEEALAQYYECFADIAKERQVVTRDRNRLTLSRVHQEPFEFAVDLLMRRGRYAEALGVAEQAKSRALVDLLAGKAIGRTDGSTPASPDAETPKTGPGTPRPELRSLVDGDAAKPGEVQGYLGADATLVEYFQTEEETYVWVVAPTGVTGHSIQAGRTIVAKKVSEYRKTLTELLSARRGPGGVVVASPSAVKLATQEERLARELHGLLVEPIESSIAGRLVYFVPHGSLHYLPFHALSDGQQRLVEKWPIAYAPSATVLKWTQRRRTRASRNVLALYDPDVGDARYRLQFARSEVDAIATLWPNVERHSGKEATESLLAEQGKQFDIIHLACHGEFKPEAPLQSRLLLAGDRANDGSLTAEELYRLDLNAWLVVLSACETGLGELTRGDDVVGLTRGLLYAGTPTVVDSLWKVDDLATSFLMGEFYKNLKTMPQAEALRRAQLATMKEYPEPVLWAAFRVVGRAAGR